MTTPKIALLFTGLMRMHAASDEFWLKFIEHTNADVFVHTWQQTDYALLYKMMNSYRPLACQVDKPIQVDVSRYDERVHPGVSSYNILSMWTGIKRGVDMVDAYYNSAGYRPDVIVKTRFDLLIDELRFDLTQPLVINMEPNKEPVCIHYKQQLLLPQADVLAYGNMDGMKRYAKTIDLIPHIYENSTFHFTSEHMLASSLCEQKMPFINQVSPIRIVRS